jgi:hypothetical protein
VVASLTDGEQVSDAKVTVENPDLFVYSDAQKLEMLCTQVDWLCTAMTQIGNTTAQTHAAISGIMNALMASPMGAGIRKQMEALNNGR